MSGLKLPKNTDEMQEDSSDNESVLEKPKKSTVAKEKKPYVMTEKRRLKCEKMREARNINVEKRRELKAIEDQKSTAEKAVVEKLTHKKMQKTQKEIKELEILKDENANSKNMTTLPNTNKKITTGLLPLDAVINGVKAHDVDSIKGQTSGFI